MIGEVKLSNTLTNFRTYLWYLVRVPFFLIDTAASSFFTLSQHQALPIRTQRVCLFSDARPGGLYAGALRGALPVGTQRGRLIGGARRGGLVGGAQRGGLAGGTQRGRPIGGARRGGMVGGDRKSARVNSSHYIVSRMTSSTGK